MKDKPQRKQSSAKSETNSERKLNEVARISTDTTVSKTHLRDLTSKTLPESEVQVYQAQSNAIEAKLRRHRFKSSRAIHSAHRECLECESPLKGTPWEDALRFRSTSVTSSSFSPQRYRKLIGQRSAKEEECIDFWMTFFGWILTVLFLGQNGRWLSEHDSFSLCWFT